MNVESKIPMDTPDIDARDQRRRRIFLVSVGLLVAVLVGIIAYRMFSSPPATVVDSSPLVSVVRPGRTAVEATVEATGTLAARRPMPVGVVGEGGQVTQVMVEPGDWVKQGQVLARVERSVQSEQARSAAASLAVAQADARLAQNELDRAQALVSRGFISKADLDRKIATRDQAQARVRVAQAQLNQQQALNRRLDIRAPADGLVLTRNVERGQIVGAGSGVLFNIAQGGQMEMMARVSEAELARIAVGNSVQVTPVGSSRSFSGQVWQISPVVDQQTRLGMARVALSYDPALRPGGFASATIVAGQAERPVLPESAIQSDPEGSYVYIVNAENVVERRAVKAGQVTEKGVTVTSGLNGDERVVILAGGFLNPGEKVRPQEAKK